jgi:hypothetical protein
MDKLNTEVFQPMREKLWNRQEAGWLKRQKFRVAAIHPLNSYKELQQPCFENSPCRRKNIYYIRNQTLQKNRFKLSKPSSVSEYLYL